MRHTGLICVNGMAGAGVALLCYFLFELVTEQAYGLLQPYIVLPYVGLCNTEWLLITLFTTIYIATAYAGTRLLPSETLADRLISYSVWLYLLYNLIVMSVLLWAMPDTYYKGARFMNVAKAILIMPETMLILMLLPLPALLANYKKRNIRMISPKSETLRLCGGVLLWFVIAIGLVGLASRLNAN